MKQALINYSQHEKCDEFYTPDNAIIPLLKYLPKNIIIWESTDFGESNITKILKENGYKVISTHINTFNFLTDIPDFEFDMIITNPPYSLKDEFLERCYHYQKPFALLMPITSLEGKRRGQLYQKNGISLIVLDRRISFIEGKTNWFNTSWFIWKVIENNKMVFEEIKE